ncbi:hypothetical protein EI555_020670, partial [Monodon monoceros]
RRRAWDNLALRHPRPRPAEGGGATATVDPPAGFVRACNPAVAAPQAPAPRGRTFPGRPPPGSHREPRSAPARSVPVRPQSPPEMPVDFTGYWKMLANENFEEYLRALDKEIVQNGDHMIIRTLSTFRNYIMDFQVGEEFEEDLTGIDDRKC